jgi:hypothetical protein
MKSPRRKHKNVVVRGPLIVLITMAFFAELSLGQANTAPASKSPSCISIVTPTLEGATGNAAEAANGVRELMASYLRGPSTNVVPLEAKLASQAAEEAKQKNCQPILVFSLSRKPGSNHGLVKALARGAGASAWSIPYGSSSGSAMAHAGAASGLQTASELAQQTKTKDEVRLEYKLMSADGQVQFGPKTERQVAKTDREDLVTPVVTRAAEAIIGHKETK